MAAITLFQDISSKDFSAAASAYPSPSPSLSPETIHLSNMEESSRRRSSVKSLLSSVNPPASPLDALVMALEATAEEAAAIGLQVPVPSAEAVDEEEDPNATVPSSPTFFMKKSTGPSLQHLPTMMLPEALPLPQSQTLTQTQPQTAAPATAFPYSSGLTPSTLPDPSHGPSSHQRKTSISSQGSVSSTNSNGERKVYPCTIGNCDKKFYQVAHLRIHERCHTGTRPFVCHFDGCDRAFTQLGNLKTHERKHTGERPYKCPHPDCDKTFTQLGNLKTHERIHDEVKPFMCRLPGCGKTFSQLGNLKTHTTKMHPDVRISDEELAIRTTSSTYRPMQTQAPRPARMIPTRDHGVPQVITHFNPYQRRPIKPQQSEEEKLLRKIRAMLHHQQRVRALEDGSEVSDEMEE